MNMKLKSVLILGMGFLAGPLQNVFACSETPSDVVQKLIEADQIGKTASGALLVSPEAYRTLREATSCSDEDIINQLEQKMGSEPKLQPLFRSAVL